MPPKQPKKKAVKKPSNRGFATTSIPKKVVEPDPTEASTTDELLPDGAQLAANQSVSALLSAPKSSDPSQASFAKGDPSKALVQDEWEQDPDERETHSLAEKLRPISEKEITKQLKIIENDKRFAKGWSGFRWSDSRLQTDILEYARNTQLAIETTGLKPTNASSGSLQEDEEKALYKLAVLNGVLEGLGFQKSRIKQCLEKIKCLEFEEAIDYLVLNCSTEELILAGYDGLSNEDPSLDTADKDSQVHSPNAKLTPALTLTQDNVTTSDDTNDKSNLSCDLSNGLIELQSDEPPHSQPSGHIGSTSTSPTIKSIILERQQQLEDEDLGPVEDPPDAIEDYVALKLSIMDQSKKISKVGTAHLKGKALKDAAKLKKEVKLLEDKVKLVQASYAFSQKKADQALKAKLKAIKNGPIAENPACDESLEDPLLESDPTMAHRRSLPSSPVLPITAIQPIDDDAEESDDFEIVVYNPRMDMPGTSSDGTVGPASSPPSPSSKLAEGRSLSETLEAEPEQNEDESGLFGSTFDEPAPSPHDPAGISSDPKKTPTCTTSIVRDMPLPKQFSGKTPQSLLDETLRRIDKFAQPQYLVTSRGSRSIRASVEIKWSNRKLIPTQAGKFSNTSSKINPQTVQTFTMEDEACRDETQAYNYVATLALFYLNSQNVTSTHRYLPVTFRELWDELEEKRKKEDDQKYLDLVKSLLAVFKHRLSNNPCLPSDQASALQRPKESSTAGFLDEKNPLTISHNHQTGRTSGNPGMMEEFAMRQRWPSYQLMLGYRATLPISVYRSEIVTTVEENQVILLCGETGCGKSTQLPAFILEHELANGRPVKIFCTQPRRISAISLAERVSQELGEPSGAVGQVGSLVGYNIRLESKTSATTRLVYATTGVVLRMLENGTDLQGITHLILDEIHERSIDSDFLLVALKTILERRPNLRVILMSATVDAEKISHYMNGCPVLKIPGRTFPVTNFFLEDVIELTGYRLDAQSDSPYVARRGKRKPVMLKTASSTQDEIPTLDDDEEPTTENAIAHTYAASTRSTLEFLDEHLINMDLIVLLLLQICWQNPTLVQRFSSAILIFLPSLDSIRKLTEILESHAFFGTSAFQIFPLHSSISNENQSLVFRTPPAGVRKIVISTNIAETGITIPDVTCVIDSGKHKEMRYDEKRQISKLVETFIARSNVTQRKGRAGRVQEGISFHLFTKHRMETHLADNPLPEMLRLSLQDLALRIKIMKIGTSIEEVLLQALDPPSTANVQRAIASLVEVKALTPTEEITPLGRHLVKLPMDVHMGKLLILGCLFRCLSPALTVAAALNSKSPFLTPFGREQEADVIKKSFKVENSDFLTICKVYNSWRLACQNDHVHQFCRKNMLSFSNLLQIEDLRSQFFGFLVDAGFVSTETKSKAHGSNSLSHKSRFCKVPLELDVNADQHKIVMGCIGAAMFPKLLVRDGAMQIGNVNSNAQGGWRTLTNSAPASIHPSSVNFSSGRRPDFGDARFVTYFNIMQSKKLYIWESGVVNEKAIFLLCGEADFKMPAESVIIDRKIKASMNPKTLLTLKILRQRFQQLFNLKMKNPSLEFDQQQQRWFDLITAAIQDDKESIKINQNEGSHRTNATANATSVKPKNRMSVVLAPAGRIPSSPSHNISPVVEDSNRHSNVPKADSHIIADARETFRTTFYETTGRLSELSFSSSAPDSATLMNSERSTSTPVTPGSVCDPDHVHYGHQHTDNFDRVT
ncbi:hypothetical protein MJO28_012051 [Puccinia striiformis f. sp. tritici]|uniref:Uncharacterized protein n=1 Tax=Puccinia striiformis f. sp. tritici TaxID=168172 RepID=A0ACC0DYU8_9BASI|nr:hypothetical protein MJO28_012051 [Puccinia striiformis f. sp. tritici]KAI7946060.1 hypothetical protein MJO29_012448 [Puccinia striiformis f. sp. tritici]